jgi:hypothetical protein
VILIVVICSDHLRQFFIVAPGNPVQEKALSTVLSEALVIPTCDIIRNGMPGALEKRVEKPKTQRKSRALGGTYDSPVGSIYIHNVLVH